MCGNIGRFSLAAWIATVVTGCSSTTLAGSAPARKSLNKDSQIVLVVQADDFGMCHAINEGIVKAFTDGILTQASAMVPCPWFDEAAELAMKYKIPTGIHGTFVSEWDYYRWRPLTGRGSLIRQDGTFWQSAKLARRHTSVQDVIAELDAQVNRFKAVGLEPLHLDTHAGYGNGEAYRVIYKRYNLARHGSHLDSWTQLTAQATDTKGKVKWLINYINKLKPGRHHMLAHPGVSSPELRSMAQKGKWTYQWGEPLRVTDLAALLSSEVKAAVKRRGIRLASTRELGEEDRRETVISIPPRGTVSRDHTGK